MTQNDNSAPKHISGAASGGNMGIAAQQRHDGGSGEHPEAADPHPGTTSHSEFTGFGDYTPGRGGQEPAYTPAMSPEAWKRLQGLCPEKPEKAE